MKQITSLIMALVLCLGLCACGANNGSQFVGKYERKSSVRDTQRPYGNGYYTTSDIAVTETITLNDDGTGTFMDTTTEAGINWLVGDVVAEGTVQWTCEGNYITITSKGIGYTKCNGEYDTYQIDSVDTYEKKAGTLHDTSINRTYIKIS